MAWQQLTLDTRDLDLVTITITAHLHAPMGEVSLGYEITSGPQGEPLQLEAMGQRWALNRKQELVEELASIVQAAERYLSPF